MARGELAAEFEIMDMGPISFHLGLKVRKDWQKTTLKLSQSAYIDKILHKYHLNLAKLFNTLMKEIILLPNERSEATQAEREQYQGMTGFLMFSMMETRPHIVFATLVVSHFANNPYRQHKKAVKTIMQYLKATQKLDIKYGGEEKEDLIIQSYSVSDYAGDHATRKLTLKLMFMLNGGQSAGAPKGRRRWPYH